MAQSILEVMTPDPVAMPHGTTIKQAAVAMRDHDVGDVVVTKDGTVCGIVTDRDITVRAVAEGCDPGRVTVGEICSSELTYLGVDATVEEATHLMRVKALRRLPIVDQGRAVGIVSIGDLAVARDRNSALADISAAAATT